jgi:hypothetical protein
MITGLVLSVFLQISSLSPGYAKALQRCHMCGMNAAASQTEFVAHLSDGSVEQACCMHCVYLLQNYFLKSLAISTLETRDFSTGAQVEAQGAYYLEGSSVIPKGSMAPFLLAFSEQGTAERYRKKYGGHVIDFKKAMEAAGQLEREINQK